MSETTSIWVCVVCGSRSNDRYGFERIDHKYNVDHDCTALAVNCMPDKNENGDYVLVENVSDVQKRLAAADSATK